LVFQNVGNVSLNKNTDIKITYHVYTEEQLQFDETLYNVINISSTSEIVDLFVYFKNIEN